MSESETKVNLNQIKLIARGRVNVDQASEMKVTSELANCIKIENDQRFFDESLATMCIRVTKYIDELSLYSEEQLIARVSLTSETKREKSKNTAVFYDQAKSKRVFKIEYLDQESDELISETKDELVKEWKYRRDERYLSFLDQLKQAINKIDSSLVSIKQANVKTQEELDLEASLKASQDAVKKAREALKKAREARKASKNAS